MAGQGVQRQRVQQLEVQVQGDYPERRVHGKPSSALAKLVWNTSDADATTVSVGSPCAGSRLDCQLHEQLAVGSTNKAWA